MKTDVSQIYDDETLMEVADGTLNGAEASAVLTEIEGSASDREVLETFKASAFLMKLLRRELNGQTTQPGTQC